MEWTISGRACLLPGYGMFAANNLSLSLSRVRTVSWFCDTVWLIVLLG